MAWNLWFAVLFFQVKVSISCKTILIFHEHHALDKFVLKDKELLSFLTSNSLIYFRVVISSNRSSYDGVIGEIYIHIILSDEYPTLLYRRRPMCKISKDNQFLWKMVISTAKNYEWYTQISLEHLRILGCSCRHPSNEFFFFK